MGAKLFAVASGSLLVCPAVPSGSHERTFKETADITIHKRDRYVVRTFGPRSPYAPIVVKALFDSSGNIEKYRHRDVEN